MKAWSMRRIVRFAKARSRKQRLGNGLMRVWLPLLIADITATRATTVTKDIMATTDTIVTEVITATAVTTVIGGITVTEATTAIEAIIATAVTTITTTTVQLKMAVVWI